MFGAVQVSFCMVIKKCMECSCSIRYGYLPIYSQLGTSSTSRSHSPLSHLASARSIHDKKINIDSSFSSESDSSGIGGVFRDSTGTVILHFGKKVDVNSAIHTKILSIKEGLLTAVASCWSDTASFSIELDSANIVAWTLDPVSVPLKF